MYGQVKRGQRLLVPLMVLVAGIAVYTVHRPALFPSQDTKQRNRELQEENLKLLRKIHSREAEIMDSIPKKI
jgi:hypothetical protein